MKKLVSMLLLCTLFVGLFTINAQATTEYSPMTIDVAMVWCGREPLAPNPELDYVGKVIKEKFNTTLNFTYAVENEATELNLMLASGELPDVLNFPFWGGIDGCTIAIKKAAQEGYLMSLEDRVAKYAPSLVPALQGNYAADVLSADLNCPEFEGHQYLLPVMTSVDLLRATPNGLNVPMVRKDILDALGMKAEDITTSQKAAELLVAIRDGNFKDANGNPVIPCSFMGGSGFPLLYNSFMEESKTDFYFDQETKTYQLDILGNNIREALLYYNELYNTGLLDKEVFSQTSAIRQAKMSNGSVAMICWNGAALYNETATTLNKTNPEMEYVPLGYIQNRDGTPYNSNTLILDGYAGSPALAFTDCAEEAEIQRFLEITEYMCSSEGKLLMYFGVEGETFEMVDGKPQYLEPYKTYASENINKLSNYGLGTKGIYALNFSVLDNLEYQDAVNLLMASHPSMIYNDQVPRKMISGFRINYLARSFDADKLNVVNTFLSDFGSVKQQVVVAPSKEEAEKILDKFLASVKAEPIVTEYVEFVNEKALEVGIENVIY